MVESWLLFAVGLLIYRTGNYSDNDVYVCYGPRPHAFHYFESCDGLKACMSSPSKINIQFAKDSLGKRNAPIANVC